MIDNEQSVQYRSPGHGSGDYDQRGQRALPRYKVGGSFTLKACYQLVSDTPVCMHGLASLMPWYNALRVSEPADWGIDGRKDKSKAYIQCPDACQYTDGGTVIYEIGKVDAGVMPGELV